MSVLCTTTELLGLVNLVREHTGRTTLTTLSADMRLLEDIGLDSLDLAELTVRIEEHFGLDVFAEGVVLRWGDLQQRAERHALQTT